uniref:Uncharacterized protein n=1 Tax=Oryza sativa subsp. japonica TaxID=39947 RepID=Q6EQW3_ORYSJ|nr:hypothetical protein [Oryza sativa Japonica Group]
MDSSVDDGDSNAWLQRRKEGFAALILGGGGADCHIERASGNSERIWGSIRNLHEGIEER